MRQRLPLRLSASLDLDSDLPGTGEHHGEGLREGGVRGNRDSASLPADRAGSEGHVERSSSRSPAVRAIGRRRR